MHGMICKALEGYVRTTHGDGMWDLACREAGLPLRSFETMLTYPDQHFHDVLTTTAVNLRRPVPALMEDIGMWIVTHPPLAPVRRLFRFSGETFTEFMYSLNEIDGRARMALPGLTVPSYSVMPLGDGRYNVQGTWSVQGAGAILCGVLQALADEYGALVMLEPISSKRIEEVWRDDVAVQVIQEDFQAPSAFQLGATS